MNLRTINGREYAWDWSKLLKEGMDVAYVNNLISEINTGIYRNLFYRQSVEGNFPKNDLVFLDIGANLGFVSIYAAEVCKRIVAIEPAPNTYPILKQITELYHNIETWNVALSNKDDKHEFFVNDINFTASSTDNTYGKMTYVTGLTLETILKEKQLRHVDVCKVDVEGAEGEALDYAQILNAKDIIDEWYVETHNCPKTGWEHKLGTLVGNFARCGYQKMEVNGMALRVRR